ncbi:hypothetical protein GCM10023168_23860 [Fodinibacter luteus]|uniref:Calcineurin-like phosphoesterase domain-containing protein n=2 Tax=Fodinibacter luteus TaxID=552064 RepID=A0ABP8KHZ7_9MICO
MPSRARRALLPLVLVAALAGCAAAAETLPTPGATLPASPVAPTTLAVVTDVGNCDEGSARVADMVDGWAPEAIVTAGDNTQGTEGCTPYTDSVDDYYGEYVRDPAGPRFWPALGNHDHENKGAGLAAYLAYFDYLSADDDPQRRWYDQQLGPVHVFVLDSEASEADLAAQRTWLRGALATARSAEPRTWNVVVFHRPAHSSGSHGPFEPMSEAAGWDYRGWGADIVLAGHQHLYEDVVVDGLHHVTAGVGASEIARPCPDTLVDGSRRCVDGPGALRLTSTPATLLLEYHQPVDGGSTVADVITLTR